MARICLLAAFSLLNFVSVELLTQKQRDVFLNYHNEKRRSVHPPASNMQHMVYDMELEGLAQRWVDRCKYKHPPESNVEYRPSGQNLGATAGSTEDESIKAVLEKWYMEHELYSYATNRCTGTCGHYTQMVWHDSNKIGCALKTKCSGIFPGVEAILIACQYTKRGNVNGLRPYAQGQGTPDPQPGVITWPTIPGRTPSVPQPGVRPRPTITAAPQPGVRTSHTMRGWITSGPQPGVRPWPTITGGSQPGVRPGYTKTEWRIVARQQGVKPSYTITQWRTAAPQPNENPSHMPPHWMTGALQPTLRRSLTDGTRRDERVQWGNSRVEFGRG